MAYMIRITRNPKQAGDGAAITLAEWCQAVSRVEHVRLADGDYSVTLPENGQVFTLRNNGGDAELHLPETKGWHRVFRWDADEIAFVRTETFANELECQLRSVAARLAEALGAHLVGDEGEHYS